MTLVDFSKVRASLANKPLVGFDGALQTDLDEAVSAKCGLIKSSEAKRGILKVNGAKRGIKPAPASA